MVVRLLQLEKALSPMLVTPSGRMMALPRSRPIVTVRPSRDRAAAGEEAIESLQITDEVEIAFDPLTGLPVSARTARVTSVVTNAVSTTGGEIMTIRRITP